MEGKISPFFSNKKDFCTNTAIFLIPKNKRKIFYIFAIIFRLKKADGLLYGKRTIKKATHENKNTLFPNGRHVISPFWAEGSKRQFQLPKQLQGFHGTGLKGLRHIQSSSI